MYLGRESTACDGNRSISKTPSQSQYLSPTTDGGRIGVANWGGIRTLLMTILSDV